MYARPHVLQKTTILSQQWREIWWDSQAEKYRGPSQQGTSTVM